ncbi:MAG TPA: hypothetical protein VHF01_10935 [Candidatus Acidoferrum sp.]|nr:hypothetical protein [Candidatus Acidoferrum sp.]
MKRFSKIVQLLVVVFLRALTCTPGLSQTAPKMKMTTDIPADLTTPDKVNTRLGELKFFDGY